jgi:alpha-1,2-mannosyltransferase
MSGERLVVAANEIRSRQRLTWQQHIPKPSRGMSPVYAGAGSSAGSNEGRLVMSCRLGKVIEAARTGSWLTRERMTVYPILLLVFYAVLILFAFATATGPMDWLRRPLGTDFSQVWVGGVEVLHGHPELPFQPEAHAAAQRQLLAPDTQFYGWHYPPYFLAVATLLALLPYKPALLIWQASTFVAYLATVRRILPHPMAGLLAMAFPAVLVNVGHGHNGFLTAALLAGGLVVLERRPLLAGFLFGLLAYKPQFGLVLPVALLAGRHWRAIAAAASTVALMTVGTVAAFGFVTWQAFRSSLPFTRTVVLEAGSTGWEKIQSAFSATRALGGGVSLAYWVQGVLTLAIMILVVVLWSSRTDYRLKSALLIVAALLSTPYVLDYDLVLLGPALAFVVSEKLEVGFRPWEKSLFAAVWITPLLTREVASVTLVPLGLCVMLTFLVKIVCRSTPSHIARRFRHHHLTHSGRVVRRTQDIEQDQLICTSFKGNGVYEGSGWIGCHGSE